MWVTSPYGHVKERLVSPLQAAATAAKCCAVMGCAVMLRCLRDGRWLSVVSWWGDDVAGPRSRSVRVPAGTENASMPPAGIRASTRYTEQVSGTIKMLVC